MDFLLSLWCVRHGILSSNMCLCSCGAKFVSGKFYQDRRIAKAALEMKPFSDFAEDSCLC